VEKEEGSRRERQLRRSRGMRLGVGTAILWGAPRDRRVCGKTHREKGGEKRGRDDGERPLPRIVYRGRGFERAGGKRESQKDCLTVKTGRAEGRRKRIIKVFWGGMRVEGFRKQETYCL